LDRDWLLHRLRPSRPHPIPAERGLTPAWHGRLDRSAPETKRGMEVGGSVATVSPEAQYRGAVQLKPSLLVSGLWIVDSRLWIQDDP